MKNRKNSLGILIMMLVFGMTVVGNLEAQTDNRLNGTWVQITEGIEFELRMRNGNFEELYNGLSFRKGTYTTNSRELTIVPTHIHGGGFNTLIGSAMGINFGLESKWYTFNEIIISVRTTLLRLVSEREANAFIESALTSDTTSIYSVDGNSLILTSTLQGQKFTLILTKK